MFQVNYDSIVIIRSWTFSFESNYNKHLTLVEKILQGNDNAMLVEKRTLTR